MDNSLYQKSVRPMEYEHLELVRAWRNHPDVRRYMYTQHEISEAEHQHWFNSASKDPRKHLLIFQPADLPLGFVHISELRSPRVADWGFYLAPDAPKGSGQTLGRAALIYGFNALGFHKICGQSFGSNYRSIKLHRSLGFREEGLLLEHHFDGRCYQNVICFGLLASEWRSST